MPASLTKFSYQEAKKILKYSIGSQIDEWCINKDSAFMVHLTCMVEDVSTVKCQGSSFADLNSAIGKSCARKILRK